MVTIDAHSHGERGASEVDLESPEYNRLSVFLNIVEQTAADLLELFQHLHNDDRIDCDHVGLRGGSMGGYIALAAVGMGFPATAVLSICGTADYANSVPGRLRRGNAGSDLARLLVEHRDRVRRVDPIFHLDRFPPRPVLLIHGAQDQVVPISGHRALFDALTPFYADHSEDLLFLTHAGEHPTPTSVEDWGWRWLSDRISE